MSTSCFILILLIIFFCSVHWTRKFHATEGKVEMKLCAVEKEKVCRACSTYGRYDHMIWPHVMTNCYGVRCLLPCLNLYFCRQRDTSLMIDHPADVAVVHLLGGVNHLTEVVHLARGAVHHTRGVIHLTGVILLTEVVHLTEGMDIIKKPVMVVQKKHVGCLKGKEM